MKATNHPFRLLMLPLLAVLMFTSCSRHSAVWPQLLEAEQLLESDLPSAGAMIDSLDATSLEGEDAALYAILKTQADYKRNELVSDSLACIATNWYGRPKTGNYHAALSWYTLGCCYTEEESTKAVDAFLKAKRLFPDTLVKYYALCEQNLGKHYMSSHLYEEAKSSFLAYRAHPFCVGDSSSLAYADYYLGMTHLRLHEFREAEARFYSVQNNRHASRSIKTQVSLQLAKVLYNENHDLANSMAFINQYLYQLNGKPSPTSMMLKGDIFYDLQEPDSAYHYFLNCVSISEDIYSCCHSYQQLAKLSLELKKYDEIQRYSEQYAQLLDSIYSRNHIDEINKLRDNHAIELHDQHLAMEKKSFVLYALLVMSFLLLLILSANWRRQKRLLALHEEFSQIRSELVQSSTKSEDTQEESEEQVALKQKKSVEQKRKMIKLCQKAFSESPAISTLPQKQTMIGEIKKLKMEDRASVCSLVSNIMSDLNMEILRDSRELTDADLLYCDFVLLGFSDTMMSCCTDWSLHAIACRKSNVKKQLTQEWMALLYDEYVCAYNIQLIN